MGRLADWANRLITHPEDDEGDFGVRVLVHIPVGILMSVPVLGWGLVSLFKFYQKNEDLHTLDEAWKDVFGAMVGYALGMAALILILVGWLLYG